MGSYLGILTSMLSPPAHEAEVRVDSQNDIHCCTTTTVVIEDSSDDEINYYSKRCP
jgi:hypothetical protein